MAPVGEVGKRKGALKSCENNYRSERMNNIERAEV